MENPHKPLLFGPHTGDLQEVLYILTCFGHDDKVYISALVEHELFDHPIQYFYTLNGGHLDSEFLPTDYKHMDLVPCTIDDELAPQPYTLWQKEQELAKLKAENERYREALEWLSDKEFMHFFTDHDDAIEVISEVKSIAREALKGGGDGTK